MAEILLTGIEKYERKAIDIAREIRDHEKLRVGFDCIKCALENINTAKTEVVKRNKKMKPMWVHSNAEGEESVGRLLEIARLSLDKIVLNLPELKEEIIPRESMSLADAIEYIEGFNKFIMDKHMELIKEGRAGEEVRFPFEAVLKYFENCGYEVIESEILDYENELPVPIFALKGVKMHQAIKEGSSNG